MKKYRCLKCGEILYSAGTTMPCPCCGGEIVEVKGMNRPNIEGIRERVNKTTAGPWEYDRETGLSCPEWKEFSPSDDDFEFIVATRTDIPALLDYIDSLKKLAQEIYDYEKPRLACHATPTERKAYALAQMILDK